MFLVWASLLSRYVLSFTNGFIIALRVCFYVVGHHDTPGIFNGKVFIRNMYFLGRMVSSLFLYVLLAVELMNGKEEEREGIDSRWLWLDLDDDEAEKKETASLNTADRFFFFVLALYLTI
ncbi:hypothetical protein QBC43DRAFT_323597 [Cladorrhinum sp. PSN259]|nr:hypothetical protein QBC43DRAFT_323597 [Cladorrhinum sp. PSN259]